MNRDEHIAKTLTNSTVYHSHSGGMERFMNVVIGHINEIKKLY